MILKVWSDGKIVKLLISSKAGLYLIHLKPNNEQFKITKLDLPITKVRNWNFTSNGQLQILLMNKSHHEVQSFD